jgi:hypothetical protein
MFNILIALFKIVIALAAVIGLLAFGWWLGGCVIKAHP